jgi:GH18 family chitinase
LAHKLAGVRFWDYSGDHAAELLSAVNRSLHRKAAEGKEEE